LTYEYDLLNRLTDIHYPDSSLSLSRTFDQDDRLTGQQVQGLLESRYSYDLMGNISDWEDLLDSSENQQFQYDLLDRLTQATRGEYNGIG
jgi:hypothetical protein